MKEERERTPLRIILQNFINHVENLEAYRSEKSYEKEFQDLKLFSENLKTSGEYSSKEGEKEFNRKKNRYKDILPFDYSRVTLSEYVGVPGSDYINANYIKGASGSPAYIASQGPLPHTVNDFWRMVVECEVQVIIMACNEEESGKHKCENYWVDKEGEEKKFGMVAIRLLKASTICPDFLVRTMQLKYVNAQSVPEERVVCQFHYGAWPDHGVPGLVRPLLEMVRLVRDTQASETLPVLVHCSAGCGRTGTICAIDYVWGLLRAGKLRLDFSLFKLVRDMRKQRIAMVQTKDQYILVHQAVRELFQDQLRMIHSHPYENIDVRGHPLLPALSSKATILQPRKNTCSDEKQDGKEKESGIVCSNVMPVHRTVTRILEPGVAPPLPHKKRIHTLTSKQEKEVENLTQKQLSIASASGNVKVQCTGLGEMFQKGDDKVIAVSEKNIQAVNPEVYSKEIDMSCDINPSFKNTETSKNLSSTQSLCASEISKASADNQPMGSVCNTDQTVPQVQLENSSTLQKPCIAKLKALFESNTPSNDVKANILRTVEVKPRPTQLVTRSHSLGAVRKPHKFTQFSARSPESGLQFQQSSNLGEVERYKSVSNIDTSLCIPKQKNCREMLGASVATMDPSNNLCPTVNNPLTHCKSEPSCAGKPLKVSPYRHYSGGKLLLSSSCYGVPNPTEKHNVSENVFSPSSVAHEDTRPALPIKRSKSLKIHSTGDYLKFSLVKKNYEQNQEMSLSEDDSNFSIARVLDLSTDRKLNKKNAHECECTCRNTGSSCISHSAMKMSCKDEVNPSRANFKSPGRVIIDSSEIEPKPRKKITKINPDKDLVPKVGPSVQSIRIANDFEVFNKFPERKRICEHVPKVSRDICRAQSLHVKRERSSPHIILSYSQENEYANVKKVESDAKARQGNETLSVRVLSADDISKCVVQNTSQNKMTADASNILEDCRNYLMSEGFSSPGFNETQRVAVVNARHKVDTVAGGLGIRERRNSFRCAVEQVADEKNSWAQSKVEENKEHTRGKDSRSGPCSEETSVKKQFELKPSSSAIRLENEKILKKTSDKCKVVERNVISKSSPLYQSSGNTSECKCVGNVKLGEKTIEVNNVQKVGIRPMEPIAVSNDGPQKNIGLNGIKTADSSTFQMSPPSAWKRSVTNLKKASVTPKHNLKTSGMADLVFRTPQCGEHSGAHNVWPGLQSNIHPLRQGNSGTMVHPPEHLGAPANQNLVMPLEVDVDQVAASMRNNLHVKPEGARSQSSTENLHHGNSTASTHFTRALEVFHQTAATIRTKFSRPHPSTTSPTRISESSSKSVQSLQNQLSLYQPQQNGYPGREMRTTGDLPKVLKKQQQYL